MIPELGLACLQLSLITLFIQSLGLSPHFRRPIIPAAAVVSLLLIAAAFFCLLYSFAVSDFSVRLVAENSHTLKPLLYKISGAWGNHEGSMLLFLFMLSFFTVLYGAYGRRVKALKEMFIPVLAVQGAIAFLVALFVVLASNPLVLQFPVPVEGAGLNPLLQDIGLALHPPMLYSGYVGCSLPFSFAVAGLLVGPAPKGWAAALRPWVQGAWVLLTIGIALGSWWAYRELGWGGYWFWDPVENASLLPWLAATALIHALRSIEMRGVQVKWCFLLSILTFTLALCGFFLVRSGVLSSVHSFAVDPFRGFGILAIITLLAGTALLLFGLNAHRLKETKKYALLSREGFLLQNNLLLSVLCFTVLLGTLYPLFMKALGAGSISVGAPYFNSVFNPIAALLLIACAAGSFTAWKQDKIKRLKPFLLLPAAIAAAGAVIFWPGGFVALLCLFAGLWLVASQLLFSYRQQKLVPMALAHMGLGVMMLAMVAVHVGGQQKELNLETGGKTEFAGREVKLESVKAAAGANYFARVVHLVVRDGNRMYDLYPETRFFPTERQMTTEAAIRYTLMGDFYAVAGEKTESGEAYAIRLYWRPGMVWLWLGVAMMAAGGAWGTALRRKK